LPFRYLQYYLQSNKRREKEVRRGIKRKKEVWKEIKSAVTANNINTKEVRRYEFTLRNA
jgi:hypothetical protein